MSRAHERVYQLLAERVQLGASARRALYAIIAALVLSGIWWLVAHFLTAWPAVRQDEMEHLAQEALALKVHGAAAFATLFALGAMSANHARPAWRMQRNRGSGSVVMTAFTVLVVTGYALYYLVGDDTHTAVSTAHWVLGLALVPVLIVHIIAGRRSRAPDRHEVRHRER